MVRVFVYRESTEKTLLKNVHTFAITKTRLALL